MGRMGELRVQKELENGRSDLLKASEMIRFNDGRLWRGLCNACSPREMTALPKVDAQPESPSRRAGTVLARDCELHAEPP